jgi:predicted DNA-binding transcriptional regulator YafY
MNFIERKNNLAYLLEMIEKGQCISTYQMSQKFKCSTRTIDRMLVELRDDGAAIKYCKESKRYKKNLID